MNSADLEQRYQDHIEAMKCLCRDIASALDGASFQIEPCETFGASSHLQDGKGVISIRRGAVDNLGYFFKLALSHPDVLMGIGDSRDEKIRKINLEHCNWSDRLSLVTGKLLHDGIPHDVAPANRSRREAAACLANRALDFLFFHECGHLAFRHPLYRKACSESGGMCKCAKDGPLCKDIAHGLEHAADHFAATMLDNISGVGVAARSAEDSVDLGLLRHAMIAIGVLFFVMDSERLDLANLEGGSHPHPSVRLLSVMKYMYSHANAIGGKDRFTEVATQWDRVIKELRGLGMTLGIPAHIIRALDEKYEDVEARMRWGVECVKRVRTTKPGGCIKNPG